MFSTMKWNFVLLTVFFSAASSLKDADVDKTITIPLNKTLPDDNREIYGDFIKLNGSSIVKFNFTDVTANTSFLIFQAHSQFQSITLSQNDSKNGTQIFGTNLGLVNIIYSYPFDKPKLDTFYVKNPQANVTVRVYVSVHVYGQDDPIPGGCNMEFPVTIAPYLEVTTNDAYISVDAAPPSTDPQCNIVNIAKTEFYFIYLPEMDYHVDNYFSGIRKMMSLKNISKYGRKLTKTFWDQRRLLSSYPGTGVIIVAVARNFNNLPPTSAVYVPNHSYGCTKMDENGCEIVEDMLSQVLCAVLLFIGLFVSFFGHRFFKTEMFLGGFFSGFIITYILVNLMEHTIHTASLVAASALSGVFFGAIWLLFWWLYGIPVLAVSLVALNAGFILASIFYYTLPVNILFLKEDLNFWTLFVMVMVLTALAFVMVTHPGNILCCALLGGFATAFAFDFFMGSNLKYIMINIVRRTVVPNYNLVTRSPPYMWRDVLVTILGLLVAIGGWSFQHWHNVGRPPFPPPPRSTRPAPDRSFMYGALSDESTQPPNRNAVRNLPRVASTPAMPRAYNERTSLLTAEA